MPMITHHNHIVDIWNQFEPIFNRLRRNIFSARGDEEILLAIGDFKIAIRIDLAHVTSVEPSAGKRLSGFALPVVVAPHDVRSANEDLLILRNPDLLISNGTAN